MHNQKYIVDKNRMKFYEIYETKCRMHIPVHSVGTKATRRKAAVRFALYFVSRENLKNLMPRSFTFVCQLYCCSSKHNNKALRITFNSCKTVISLPPVWP